MNNKALSISNFQEPEQPVARLREDLQFDLQNVGDQQGFLCHDPARGEYFRFGQREFDLTRLFDGTRTPSEVLGLAERQGIDADELSLKQLVWWLTQHNLLERRAAPRDPQAGATNALIQTFGKAVSIRLPLVDADIFSRRCVSSAGLLFTRIGFLAWLVIVLASTVVASSNWERFTTDLRQIFDPSGWIWLVVAWCVIKVFHEAGHAIAASRQGVVVGRAGVILLLFAPIAYVDVTDAWRLPNRMQRIWIAMAGVYVELLIAAFAVFVWSVAPASSSAANIAINVIVAAGPATLLINANPLMRLDGYFALSDLLQIPNLGMHGGRQLCGWVEWFLLGRRRPQSLLVGWRSDQTTNPFCCGENNPDTKRHRGWDRSQTGKVRGDQDQ